MSREEIAFFLESFGLAMAGADRFIPGISQSLNHFAGALHRALKSLVLLVWALALAGGFLTATWGLAWLTEGPEHSFLAGLLAPLTQILALLLALVVAAHLARALMGASNALSWLGKGKAASGAGLTLACTGFAIAAIDSPWADTLLYISISFLAVGWMALKGKAIEQSD